MGVVITVVRDGVDVHVVDVTATNTKDKTATIPHTFNTGGFPLTPANVEVYLIPLLAEAYVARWRRVSVDTTNVVLEKLSTGGSANAAAQLRVTIKRPHSIGS